MKRKRNLKGLLIVISSPSGGGKTTIAQKLLGQDKRIVRSVSCTTRPPRPGERNGKDYFFISGPRFQKLKSQDEFLEWAHVHDHFYGTPKAWVEKQFRKGKSVLFVIDVQGGKAIKKLYPGALLIFLKPPSFAVLKKRLIERGSDDPRTLKLRLQNARWEMKQSRYYDHQVVNGRLSKAVLDTARIIQKERKKA